MSGSTDRMDHRYQGWSGPPGTNGGQWQSHGHFPGQWAPMSPARSIGVIATVLGFIVWWPIGLTLLFSQLWSRRMGCWTNRTDRTGSPPSAWGWTPPWAGMCGPRQALDAKPATSGNRAFDEYRVETLRRLEDEQREFGDFLDRLRFAKDKSEFDNFMTDRRQRANHPPAPPTGTDGQPNTNPERT